MKCSVYLSIFLLIPFYVSSQCPEGDVYFYEQADIDDFLENYPNCTSIEGNLILDNFGNTEPLDLTGLTQIQEVEEDLAIVWVGYLDTDNGIDVAGSLEGLENITSVGSLVVGSGFSFAPTPIESLDPINNVSGQLERFILNHVQLDEALPDFENITAIGNLHFSNLHVAGSTPQFPSLTALSNLTVYSFSAGMSTFSTLYLPDNLTSIQAYPGQGIDNSKVWIEGNENLVEIVGGNSLTAIQEVELLDNENLLLLDGFSGVTEVQSLSIQGCHEEVFHSFEILTQAETIVLDVNNYSNCSEPKEAFAVRIGEDSDELRVMRDGFILNVNDINNLEVTSPLSVVGGLEIHNQGVSNIDGFSTLDSIIWTIPVTPGDLVIDVDILNALPQFNDLKYIGRDLDLNFGENSTNLQDLQGFESLEVIGMDFKIFDFWGTSALQSLEGLDNLEQVFKLEIVSFQQLNDISVLEDMDHILHFKLVDLPSLNQDLSFTDLTWMPYLKLQATGLEFFPQFLQVDTVGTLEMIEQDFITDLDGFVEASFVGSITLLNNPQLQALDFDSEVEVNFVEWVNNPQLQSCADSPVICHILSVVDPSDIELDDNGSGCNDLDEILAQCTLSASALERDEFLISTTDAGELLVRSPISGSGELRIYDLTGKLLMNRQMFLTEGDQFISMPNISEGIYLIEIRCDQLRGVGKVMIKEP
jgi:hypothetical protein